MPFPVSPANGQIYKNKRWNSTKGVWESAYDSSATASTLVSRDSSGQILASTFSGAGTSLTGTAASLTAGSVAWSGITSKPTTISGFAITDAITTANIGSQSVSHAATATDSSKLPIAGGSMTGKINGKINTGGSLVASNSTGSFEAIGDTTNAASMSFHRPALGAINIGLDIDNVFKIGGWAFGSNYVGISAADVSGIVSGSTKLWSGSICVSGGQALNYPNTGYGITGAVHFTGAVNGQSQGITWTANGQTQAGLLVHNDNGLGTTMRLLTTESYATGPQTALTVENTGNVTIERGSIIFPNKGFGSMKIGNGTGMLSGYPTQNYNVIKSDESIYFDSANKYVLAIDGDGGYTHFWRGTSTTGFFLHGSTGNTTGVMSNLSDRNLKKDISELTGALDLILKLKPTNYQWKEPEKYGSGVKQGFIAQEVETVKSDWVIEMGEYKALQLQGLDAYLVKAIQEISARLTILENK